LHRRQQRQRWFESGKLEAQEKGTPAQLTEGSEDNEVFAGDLNLCFLGYLLSKSFPGLVFKFF
jgi:hypothetical protein